MVTNLCYEPYDDRRYSHRYAYPTPVSASEHRRLSAYYAHFDPVRVTSMSAGGDEDRLPTRKRIPVACGRCRKRKIRCSGDGGVGEPCSNCRNAGSSPCLFLRVSSTETPLSQGNSGFTYNLADSRAHQARGVTTLPVPGYHASDTQTQVDAWPYRNAQVYAYSTSANGRNYVSWNGTPGLYETAAPDQPGQTVDVGEGYSHIYAGPYAPQEGRYPALSTVAIPAIPRAIAPYPESEPAGYVIPESVTASPASSTTTLVHRPAPTSDAGNTTNNNWCHSVHSGLPSAPNGGTGIMSPVPERIQPAPVSYVRSSSVSSNGPRKDSSSPNSSASEVASISSYSATSYEASPAASYPSALATVVHPSPAPRSGELYVTSSPAPASPAVMAPSPSDDFPPPSTSSYTYRDTTAAAAAVAAGNSPYTSSTRSTLSATSPPFIPAVAIAERKPKVEAEP